MSATAELLSTVSELVQSGAYDLNDREDDVPCLAWDAARRFLQIYWHEDNPARAQAIARGILEKWDATLELVAELPDEP